MPNKIVMTENDKAYGKDEIVSIYTGTPKLFKGEAILIDQYKKEMGNATFLDIGIGGGRTTYFIAPLVRAYQGVDYSEAFVSFVAAKYKEQKNVAITFGDARDLNQISSGNPFNFILFSFNGIDCVNIEGRSLILKEAFRLLKPGGHFWFSFHNICSLPKLYSFQAPKNPLNWLKEWQRHKKVKEINGPISQYQDKDFCTLRDGADFFETEVLYIRPSVQYEMLQHAGFTNIQYYHAQSGAKLTLDETNNTGIDWIYVDCTKPGL